MTPYPPQTPPWKHHLLALAVAASAVGGALAITGVAPELGSAQAAVVQAAVPRAPAALPAAVDPAGCGSARLACWHRQVARGEPNPRRNALLNAVSVR